jgi:hypothetical protein
MIAHRPLVRLDQATRTFDVALGRQKLLRITSPQRRHPGGSIWCWTGFEELKKAEQQVVTAASVNTGVAAFS